MSFEMWVESPQASAIGWTLMHSLWQGALIAAGLMAGLGVMRSSRARYLGACVAMLAMIVVVGVTLASLVPETVESRTSIKTLVFTDPNIHNQPVSLPSRLVLAALVPWLAPLWIFGIWIFCVWNTIAWISARRLKRRGVCCAPESWQREITRLSTQLRVTRPILLLESCLVEVPMVFGHLRPVILMPIGLLAGLPPDQIEAILLHELAHIGRCDYIVNVLQRSVEGLLFYHPVVWWISSVIRDQREYCCDDVVVATLGSPGKYAAALAALEHDRRSGLEPAVAATGGHLVKRIRRLLSPEAPKGGWIPLFASAILVAATTAVTMGAGPSEVPRQGPAAESDPRQTSARFLSKWIDQDVVYIIEDDEAAAFKRLTTDDERYHFIEQFWLRRDPSPGTEENEFRDEHYRRIAYANERFVTTARKPGWQTDRGHIYIVYGPPDQIESHPSPDGGKPPYEDWRYGHIDNVGDDLYISFIDRTRNGDYPVAPVTSLKMSR